MKPRSKSSLSKLLKNEDSPRTIHVCELLTSRHDAGTRFSMHIRPRWTRDLQRITLTILDLSSVSRGVAQLARAEGQFIRNSSVGT